MTTEELASVRVYVKRLLPALNDMQIDAFARRVKDDDAEKIKDLLADAATEPDNKQPHDALRWVVARMGAGQSDGMAVKGSEVVRESREAQEAADRRETAIVGIFADATPEETAEARRRAVAELIAGPSETVNGHRVAWRPPGWTAANQLDYEDQVMRWKSNEEPMRGMIAKFIRDMRREHKAGAA